MADQAKKFIVINVAGQMKEVTLYDSILYQRQGR
jgi:hypothetical protein